MNFQVTDLFIYPIKSLAGIRVEKARVEEMGFEHDRRWMLIDRDNNFVTQRKYSILSQFFVRIDKNSMEISFQNLKHHFYVDEIIDKPIFSKVWDDQAKVFEVSLNASKWFTNILGFECKLVKIVNNGDRTHWSIKTNSSLTVSLADGYPYLLIGSESLNLLNQKLQKPIAVERFRPNIVIQTLVPHEEDDYSNFKIGALEFINIKPCSRCVMINIDPKTGQSTKETLRVLNSYRKLENSVYFGINVICKNKGILKVGDIFKIEKQ